jgi:hypothetical protein
MLHCRALRGRRAIVAIEGGMLLPRLHEILYHNGQEPFFSASSFRE